MSSGLSGGESSNATLDDLKAQLEHIKGALDDIRSSWIIKRPVGATSRGAVRASFYLTFLSLPALVGGAIVMYNKTGSTIGDVGVFLFFAGLALWVFVGVWHVVQER